MKTDPANQIDAAAAHGAQVNWRRTHALLEQRRKDAEANRKAREAPTPRTRRPSRTRPRRCWRRRRGGRGYDGRMPNAIASAPAAKGKASAAQSDREATAAREAARQLAANPAQTIPQNLVNNDPTLEQLRIEQERVLKEVEAEAQTERQTHRQKMQ